MSIALSAAPRGWITISLSSPDEPVDHVDAEVAVAAVADEGVGQEVAVAHHHHALLPVADGALEGAGDGDRPRDVAAPVAAALELAGLDAAARRDLDQRPDPPVVVLDGLDLARLRVESDQVEAVGDGVAAVHRCDRERGRGAVAGGLGIGHDARRQHQPEHLGDRRETAQRLRIDQP